MAACPAQDPDETSADLLTSRVKLATFRQCFSLCMSKVACQAQGPKELSEEQLISWFLRWHPEQWLIEVGAKHEAAYQGGDLQTVQQILCERTGQPVKHARIKRGVLQLQLWMLERCQHFHHSLMSSVKQCI